MLCIEFELKFSAALLIAMYEEDLWTEIAKFLDGKSLVMLAATSKWFHRIIMEESIWKHACLRDLQVPDPGKVTFKWINLYATTFSKQFSFYNWMRIGAFSFDSHNALLTKNLIPPLKILKEKTTEMMLELNGCCVVRNVKSGIWIADLQLVRCPVCDLNTCDGTMQVLDARHIELFLSEGYQDGSWDYELLGSHNEKKQADGASAGIFDVKHLKDCSTSAVLDLKSWIGKPNDWQPKALITPYAVAVNTNLQENEGLHIKFHVMKSGKNGEIVSIRISEQLQYDFLDSICGNNPFEIRFPFGIEGQNLQNCSYPGFSLRCSSQGRSILSLPGAGDYYVRDIDYLTQEIQLYDPSNCLPKRLFNFSTASSPSSPFKAVAYRNYTFLTCSTNSVLSRLNVIGCLSNSTTSILATSSSSVASQMTSLYSCSIINSSSVPVSWAFQYESDFLTDLNTDLVLTWDEPNCQECEVKQGVCGFKNAIIREIQCFDSPGTGSKKGRQVFKFIAITLVIPAITCLVGVSCYICLGYRRFSRAAAAIQSFTTRTTVAPQLAAITGLDDSTIESYTKVVLGESGRVPGPNHETCPICLTEYHPKEIVKCIPECEHCFHAECIDEWLKIKGSCPVCRNNPSPAHIT
ncbi:hypothetical protein HAX54_014313 [Datura stramonium]|uniref:non-specific serine/threonine protein kinase n=1 Tax=Datura stramonium TaxID=4076 RepID=A0ABS8TPR5_DATST|nr:hypothetical protein [Datura stramonium]